TVELHADTATGALLGKCTVPSTANAWSNQTCMLDQPVTGVARLYLTFSGAMHLNWLKFAPASSSGSGSGGTSGGSGGTAGGSGGGSGSGGAGGSGGSATGTGGSSASGGSGGGPPGTGGSSASG